MTTNPDKINHYDPDKIYKFEFTEKEISTIENAIERHIQHQEEDVPQELQKRWKGTCSKDHFLMEEKKLLKKFYDVSDQVDDAWHEQVDNDILHESLNDQMKKIIGEN
jgi:hypothetical protein